MCRRSASFIAAALPLAIALAVASAQSARAASWLEMNFYLSGPRYEGVMPPCDYPDALIKISSRFNERENNFWNTNLKIVAFERIRETAYRPWAANTIPRRFCSGLVEVSDGFTKGWRPGQRQNIEVKLPGHVLAGVLSTRDAIGS